MEPRLKNAAAPAVQASAWLVGEGGGTILTRAAEWAAEKHDQGVEVTPLYAHPPAQGSESGGEAWRVENDGQTVKFWVGTQGFTVASLEGDDDEPGYLPLMENLLKKALAALSQPGPASEGDGE